MLEAEKRNDALDNIKGSGNISRVQTLEFRISLGGGGSKEIWNSSENMHFFFNASLIPSSELDPLKKQFREKF